MEQPTPLRVLVVAPRSASPDSLPSRARIEAVFDALEAQGEGIQAEWLWPSTVEALEARLADGALSPVTAIYWEGALADGDEGERIGAALSDHGVRLLILSLRRPSEWVAPAALARGPVRVVAIAECVSAGALREGMTAYWTALSSGRTLGQAAGDARQILERHDNGRRDDPNEAILSEWGEAADAPLVIAPAKATEGVSKVVRFPSAALAPAWQRLATESEPGGLPAAPPRGLIGRGREIDALETILRAEPGGPAWLCGYEGLGKTALALHLARWLVRVGPMRQAVYTSFAGGGSAELALYHLGQRLIGEEFKLGENDPIGAIERALIETPALVVWDHLDAVLPEGDASLSTEALAELWQLAERFSRAGASRVLLVADLPDWPASAPVDGDRQLTLGLPAQDEAEQFAGTLTAHSPSGVVAGQLLALAGALGGHPLALAMLAPLIERAPAGDLQASLREIMPGLDAGEARLRNQALDLAYEQLFRAVGERLRPGLAALGVFADGFMEPLGSTVMRVEPGIWAELKRWLVASRLVWEVRLPGLNVPCIRFHPSLARHAGRRLIAAQRAALGESHSGSYAGLLSWMNQNLAESPAPVRTLLLHEWANLRRGLLVLLNAQNLTLAVDYLRYLQRFQEMLGFTGERDQMAARVEAAARAATPAEGPLGRPGVQLLIQRGERLLAMGRPAEAAGLLQQVVARVTAENGLSYVGEPANYDLGVLMHRLGRALRASGRADLAVGSFAQAESRLQPLSPTDANRLALQEVYTDLGEALVASMRADLAEQAYAKGIEIAAARQDRRAMATLHSQMGLVVLGRDDVARAREHFQAALEQLIALDDTAGRATAWSQLGLVAWRAGDAAEAERCYQQGLALAQKAEQPVLQAQIWTQLAQLAAQAGEAGDAEIKYLQALSIYQRLGLKPALIATELVLGDLLLREFQIAKAKSHAEAARQLVEGLGPEAHPWEAYALLERIAEAEGDEAQARNWRAQAHSSYWGSADCERMLQSWEALIQGVARAGRGEALEAETVETVEGLEAKDAWKQLAAAIWRILGGERDETLYEGLDYVDAAIVRRTLERIASPESGAAPEALAERANAEISLEQLVAAAYAAAQGDAQAQRVVASVLAGLAQESAPEPLRRFALALARILQGERSPAVLDGLPDAVIAPLRALLDKLAE